MIILDFDLQVTNVMKKQDDILDCKKGDLILKQLVELTRKQCGCISEVAKMPFSDILFVKCASGLFN